jgi:hypothetical protein
MIHQRIINLNPAPDRLEVFKISYPAVESNKRAWKLQPMRFIAHSGRAK